MFQITIRSQQQQLLKQKDHDSQIKHSNMKAYKYSTKTIGFEDWKPFHHVVMEICDDLYHVLIEELKKCPNFRHGFLAWILHIRKGICFISFCFFSVSPPYEKL